MRKWIAILAAAAVFPMLGRAADTALFDALRKNDVASIQSLVSSGADVNAKDDSGATALMYAAVYSSPKEMQLLIEKGADVNAVNANGSTALMWAAGDTAKVDLLLKHKASVAAKTKDGTTALLAAANHGNSDVIRRLVSHGADAKAATTIGIGVQSLALFRTDNAVGRTLSAARLPIAKPARAADSPVSNSLFDPPVLKKFLDLGIAPDETLAIVTREVPAVGFAAYAGLLDSLRELSARGANLNVKDTYGNTPLMMAAGAAKPNAAVVKFLLDRGADVQAKDNNGRTALDWALLQGETPAVPLLRAAGATAAAPPPAPPPPVASPRTARDAVARAIEKLQPVGPTFNQRFRCISCHNQSLPQLAVTLAARRDVTVNRELAAHPATATLAMWTPQREQLLVGNGNAIGGFIANVTYALAAFDEEGIAANATTDAVVHALFAAQNRDGSWLITDVRPPIGDNSAMSFTALAIRGLRKYTPPGRRPEMQVRVAQAREYLRRTQPANTQDEAFKLMGLVWSAASDLEITAQSDRLRKLQRADGGWSQTPTMESDAYATGQSLYALRIAGMVGAAVPYSKGVEFLLRTQLEDGSWFVRSRAFGFQPYFDAGFPHGRDQFISAAATSWAVIALARAI